MRLHTLRDFWTSPGGGHFDKLVHEFVEIYVFYLLDVGVDGLRLDTVKHVHHEFWDAFTERLRKRLGSAAKDKLIFGEVYDGDPTVAGRYTWRSDAPAKSGPCLDSVLDFSLCFAMRDYLRREQVPTAMAERSRRRCATCRRASRRRPSTTRTRSRRQELAAEVGRLHREPRWPGLLPRARRDRGAPRARPSPLAGWRRYPLPLLRCGDGAARDVLRHRTGIRRVDGSPFSRRRGLRDVQAEGQRLLPAASPACERPCARIPALREGRFEPLWVDNASSTTDDGIFAFARVGGKERVLVVVNASSDERRLALPTGFPPGTALLGRSALKESSGGSCPWMQGGHSLPCPPGN